jgi:hypothetical protein
MPAIDYADILVSAQALIEDSGRPVKLYKKLATIADANKPWKPAGGLDDDTEVETFGTFVPIASDRDLGMEWQSDEMFKRAKHVCLVAGGDTDLMRYEALVDEDDEQYGIGSVKVLKPGSTVMLYAFALMQ